MFQKLVPHIYVKSLYQIPLLQLKERGINALIIDLDNTITGWNKQTVDPGVVTWFEQLTENGFKACVASNNSHDRVVHVARELGIPFVAKAGKPRAKAFRNALRILESNAAETAVIGDQIFTDVLGGNRAGLYTVLVAPLARKEFIGTRAIRMLERLVIRYVLKKRPEGE